MACRTVREPAGPQASWPRYTLRATESIALNLPGGERFDASGLLLRPTGELLVVNDRGPLLYRIDWRPGDGEASLVPLPELFPARGLARFGDPEIRRYDLEGLAQDSLGRLYVCDEINRWILRFDPGSGQVERLEIDWAPVRAHLSRHDPNASWEGIAVGAGRIFVANERAEGRIVEVDAGTLRVTSSFVVRPRGSQDEDVHYSDLAWWEGDLYVLLRQHRTILRVDPASRQVRAQYDFGDVEGSVSYWTTPFIGMMEGLAVDAEFFWLATDNNGLGRTARPGDTRPTLFRCPRPENENPNIEARNPKQKQRNENRKQKTKTKILNAQNSKPAVGASQARARRGGCDWVWGFGNLKNCGLFRISDFDIRICAGRFSSLKIPLPQSACFVFSAGRIDDG